MGQIGSKQAISFKGEVSDVAIRFEPDNPVTDDTLHDRPPLLT